MSTSSPSPIKKRSIKSAIGSGLQAQGPPATTILVSPKSILSFVRIGIFPSFNIFKTLVKLSSYCKVNPIKSKSLIGSPLSRA